MFFEVSTESSRAWRSGTQQTVGKCVLAKWTTGRKLKMSLVVAIVEESDGSRGIASTGTEEIRSLSEQIINKVDLSVEAQKCYTAKG